jgi:hypothetical protein
VWEFIESAESFALMDKISTGESVATHKVTHLIEQSAVKWQEEEGDYRDDITAIAAFLPGVLQMMEDVSTGKP